MTEQDDYEEILEEVKDILVPKGIECGQKIAEILRKRGHDMVIPLYRSAAVIEIEKSKDKVPYISIRSYGDPHFSGAEEIKESNVTEDPYEYLITGGRIGALTFWDALSDARMETKEFFEFMSKAEEEEVEEE